MTRNERTELRAHVRELREQLAYATRRFGPDSPEVRDIEAVEEDVLEMLRGAARRPPDVIDVVHDGGFIIESTLPYPTRGLARFNFDRRRSSPFDRLPIGNTLWRPASVLRGARSGRLVTFDENAFYQRNDDVTLAVYRVPGYGYPVLAWFDNATGERIA